MSKFQNVLLAFKFSKLLNNQEKLTGGENTLLATSKGANIQNLSDTIFAFEIFEIAQRNKKVSSLEH